MKIFHTFLSTVEENTEKLQKMTNLELSHTSAKLAFD